MKIIVSILIIGFLAAAQGLTEQQKRRMRELSNVCKPETGVSQEAIDRAIKGEVVDDPKLKEQALCILKKIGFANEAGDLQVDVIKTKLRENAPSGTDVDAVVSRCTARRSSVQQTAHDALKCLLLSS